MQIPQVCERAKISHVNTTPESCVRFPPSCLTGTQQSTLTAHPAVHPRGPLIILFLLVFAFHPPNAYIHRRSLSCEVFLESGKSYMASVVCLGGAHHGRSDPSRNATAATAGSSSAGFKGFRVTVYSARPVQVCLVSRPHKCVRSRCVVSPVPVKSAYACTSRVRVCVKTTVAGNVTFM